MHEPELFEVRQVHPTSEGCYVVADPHRYYVRCKTCGDWLLDGDPAAAAQACVDHRSDGRPLSTTSSPARGRTLPDPFGGVLVMTLHDAEEHDALAETLGDLVRTTGAAAGVVLVEGEQLEVRSHDELVRALATALADGDASDPNAWEAWRAVAEPALARLGRAGWSLVPVGPEHVVERASSHQD